MFVILFQKTIFKKKKVKSFYKQRISHWGIWIQQCEIHIQIWKNYGTNFSHWLEDKIWKSNFSHRV